MPSNHDSHKLTLLGLPAEIRAQVLQHALNDIDISFFLKMPNAFQFQDFFKCEPCLVQHPQRDQLKALHDPANWHNKNHTDADPSLQYQDTFSTNNLSPSFDPDTGSPAYTNALVNLLICKSLFIEALPILQRTSTIHIANPDAITAARHRAPASLRNTIQNIVLYIHLTTDTQIPWMRALDALPSVFPALKKIRVNYHMRPPISYEFLMDALYLTIPILSWPAPLCRPLFVRAEETQAAHDGRTEFAKSEGTAVLSATGSSRIDSQQDGVTVHCCYKTAEVLFEARFLGNISTCDSVEEHTAVIRALFCDGPYVAVARKFVAMCRGRGGSGSRGGKWVSAGVPGVHLPTFQTGTETGADADADASSLPPEATSSGTTTQAENTPREPGQLQDPAASAYTGLFGAEAGGGGGGAGSDPVVNHIQRCLLEVARRYERPWFEKLQRRRIVELYMQQGGMSQAEAEMLVDRQTAEMGEAGVQGVIEGILASDPDLDE